LEQLNHNEKEKYSECFFVLQLLETKQENIKLCNLNSVFAEFELFAGEIRN